MWDSLHRFAATYPESPADGDAESAAAWLRDFARRFPEDCPCLAEWEKALAICPPPLRTSRRDFFRWTLALHDRVNVILGKPIWLESSKAHPLLQTLREEGNHLYAQRLGRNAVNPL